MIEVIESIVTLIDKDNKDVCMSNVTDVIINIITRVT